MPEGLVGPLSIAHANVFNGIPCTAFLDSGSQVAIVFDSWYTEHLFHVPLRPISGLNLWGLIEEDSSYPYWSYIQIALELPEKTPGKKNKAILALALMCPDPRCSNNIFPTWWAPMLGKSDCPLPVRQLQSQIASGHLEYVF